jgi:hypothetical protein
MLNVPPASLKGRERDEGRIEREPQEFFMAYEMRHFLDFHTSICFYSS